MSYHLPTTTSPLERVGGIRSVGTAGPPPGEREQVELPSPTPGQSYYYPGGG